MQRKIKTNKAEEILSGSIAILLRFQECPSSFFVLNKISTRRTFDFNHVSSSKTFHRLTRATIQLADYKLEQQRENEGNLIL